MTAISWGQWHSVHRARALQSRYPEQNIPSTRNPDDFYRLIPIMVVSSLVLYPDGKRCFWRSRSSKLRHWLLVDQLDNISLHRNDDIVRLFSRSLSNELRQLVSEWVSEWGSQSVNQSVVSRQSVSLSVRQSVSPSVRQSVSPSVRQSVSPSVRQSVSQSVSQPRSHGPLSSSLEKVPWLRLVTCLLDFADSRKMTGGRGKTVKVCLH